MPAAEARAAPSAGGVWLDVGPGTLTPGQTQELERLLAHGLRRRSLELTPLHDGEAIWVVQVRAIVAELFVLVVSGPALPGSGVSKSRRIDVAGLGPDVLSLSVAQAAEELLDAARNTTVAPASPSSPPPSPSPPPAAAAGAPLAPAPRSAPWTLDAALEGTVDSYSSGLMAVGGGAGVHLARGRWGLVGRVTLVELLPEVTALGRVAGWGLGFALGPQVTFAPVESLRLGVGASAEARWLHAHGGDAAEGLAGADGRGWAWLALSTGEVEWRLAERVQVRARVSLGPVVRGVRFAGVGEVVGGATGIVASVALGVGLRLW